MTEGRLKSVQEKFEVMMKKEKDMTVKIEQGHYIDAVKVMQMRAELEGKWESERKIFEVRYKYTYIYSTILFPMRQKFFD